MYNRGMAKHFLPQVGEYWIVTTTHNQFVMRILEVLPVSGVFGGEYQYRRTSARDPFVSEGIRAFGLPLSYLTERVKQ